MIFEGIQKMEELFVGNSVILLFWVYISFMIEVREKYKKIILMYLITYITNILNIVPTVQSYGILLLALFLEIEFLEDKFKKQIINNFFEKLLDFGYIMISQYAFVSFTIALVISSNFVISKCTDHLKIILQVLSVLLIYIGCKNASSQKYRICSFDTMKGKIDRLEKYRKFIQKEERVCNPYCVLSIEDGRFYSRGQRYTLFNMYYLQNVYLGKIRNMFCRFLHSSNKKASLKRFLRGYSTIEMQLLRTLAIEDGYDYIIRRKFFEIIYSRLFWKNLKIYYKNCGCDVSRFKDYILYLYLRSAPCLNRGQEQRIEEVIGRRKNIEEYSEEELFILTLCFSGKIKREYVLELYEDTILKYGLDECRLEELVYLLNQ